MTRVLLPLLALATVLPAVAEEGRPDASIAPHEHMQALAPLAGRWEITSEYTTDGGATWTAAPPSTVRVAYRMKDLMLMESPQDTSVPGFHVETVFSWDQYRERYRIAAMDDSWGLMDVYEGALDGDALVATNLRAGTTFPIGEGRERHFRLTIPVTAQDHVMRVDASEDGGESWQPSFRISYRRLAEGS